MKEMVALRLQAESQAFSCSEQRGNSYLLMQMITDGIKTPVSITICLTCMYIQLNFNRIKLNSLRFYQRLAFHCLMQRVLDSDVDEDVKPPPTPNFSIRNLEKNTKHSELQCFKLIFKVICPLYRLKTFCILCRFNVSCYRKTISKYCSEQ